LRSLCQKFPVYPDLSGKTAFVNPVAHGASALKLALARANRVRVAVSGRNVEMLGRVVEDLMRFDVEAISIAADCTDADAIERAQACTEAKLGPVDILLASQEAAPRCLRPSIKRQRTDWRSGIDHNLTATFQL